jgi:hypothetical protein
MTSSHPSSRPDSQVESLGMAPNTPSQDPWLLQPPRASYLEQTPESVSASSRGSVALHSGGNNSPLLAQDEKRLSEAFVSPELPNSGPSPPSRKRSVVTRPIFWIIALAVLIIVVVAVIVPVYFLVIKPHSSDSESSASGAPSGTGGSGGSGSTGKSLTTGGNGSVVTTSDGTTFTYINNFDGFCKFAYFFRVFINPSRALCLESVVASLSAFFLYINVAATPRDGLTIARAPGNKPACKNYSPATTYIYFCFSDSIREMHFTSHSGSLYARLKSLPMDILIDTSSQGYPILRIPSIIMHNRTPGRHH